MKRILILLFLLLVSLSGWAQTWRQAVAANNTGTVSFSSTLSGSVDVVLAFASPRTGLTVTDSKSQAYTLDACTGGTSGTIYGDSYTCVYYVCGGSAGVTSATVTAPEGGDVLATEFFEGTGIITTSNCAGAVNTATNSSAPAEISLTPDQSSELGLVGFACAGAANGVSGNVTYSNQLDAAANPVATTVITSTSAVTAEVGSSCIPSDDENPNGWNATFAAFRTQQPSGEGPTLTVVQHMLSGDSICKEELTCVVSLSSPTTAGHILMLGITGAGGTGYPSVSSISGDSAWKHAASCLGTANGAFGDYVFTDCYYILSAAGGASTITVTFTGQTAPNIYNMDVEFLELSCSSSCTAGYDTSNSLLDTECSTCGSETLALSGSNDAIMQLANFEYAYGSVASPYTLLDEDSVAGNAFAYLLDATSGASVNWGQSGGSGDALTAGFALQVSPSAGTCPTSVPVPSIAACAYNENLGSEAVRSTSSAQALNVSIASGTTVGSIAVLTTGIANKDFANATGSTCAASTYATATNCVVNVSFAPLASGLRRGAVVFFDGSGNVLATVPVYGVGTAPQVAFGPGGAQTNVGSGFSKPEGVAVDGAGNVYVADFNTAAVYMVTPGGTQTTVGSGFSKPEGVAVDGAGNVYVADFNAAAVYMVTPGGAQTTVGGGFGSPAGVAVDGAGNVYIADIGKAAVYKVTPGGTQTTVGSGFIEPEGVAVDAAGDLYVVDPGVPAVYEVTAGGTQTTVGSGFMQPEGVAVDAAGNVYIVDAGASTVYEVTLGGPQSTVTNGLDSPAGLAVDGSGDLYVANTGRGLVVKIDRADAPSLSFASTNVGSTSADSPKTVEVENIGNMALTLTDLSYPTDFPEATGDDSACTSTTSLNPAKQCDLPIDFTPQSVASLIGDVALTDNALNMSGMHQSIAVNGTGIMATPASLTSPAPGSTFAGPSATFTWTAAAGATWYDLWLGSTGVGSNNVYDSGAKTATSVTATGLPTNGETIYARLFTDFNGVEVHTDYTYTAAAQGSLTSPAPGSTFAGPSATFTWTAAAGATWYDLWLGSTGVGSNNVYDSGAKTVTSITANGLPTNGEMIYARLFTNFNGVEVHTDYIYTADTQAALTSPAPGSTLTGPSATFAWTAATGATWYDLWLGSTGVGSNNVYDSGAKTVTSITANGLPTNGEMIYARLFTNFNGVEVHTDYIYTADTQAALTSPAPGSTLAGPSATFTWTAATGATWYDLWLGSTGVGSNNVYDSGAKTVTSITANGLPTNGETIYARLFTNFNGVEVHTDYTYTAQ